MANGEAVSPVEYCIKTATHTQTGLRGQAYRHGQFANYHITFPIYWLFMMNNISKTFQHLQIQIMAQSYVVNFRVITRPFCHLVINECRMEDRPSQNF